MLGDLTHRLDQRRGVCVLIAIKERLHCKTRLAEALPPRARVQLVRSMLAAVLSAAGGAQTVRQVIVVSPERDSVPADVPVLSVTVECLNCAIKLAHKLWRGLHCWAVGDHPDAVHLYYLSLINRRS